VKLLLCVIGVERSSPELREPFQSETFGNVAFGATVRPHGRLSASSRILQKKCWLLVASAFVPLCLEFRCFMRISGASRLRTSMAFEMRHFVGFSGHLNILIQLKYSR
jgi:hypothetical protein